jgi:putative ABC transport system permease protein
VITRAMARKYFGQDAPIGQVLELNRMMPLRVGAVLQDLPSNTHLTFQIYASGLNAGSPLHAYDAQPRGQGSFGVSVRTYVRLPDAAAAARINAAMPAFYVRHVGPLDGKTTNGVTGSYRLIPVADLHLYPLGGTTLININGQANPATLVALSLIAALILGVAAINFVNLMTARAARRAVEVGVRKAAGARRRDLVAQFIGEAVIYALIGLVLAAAAVELLLPSVRVLLDRPLELAYWREPGLLGACLAMSLAVGALAGIYPALVLSSFRPAAVLKGVRPQTSGSAAARAGLTTLQFAFLIGLILSVIVVGRQTRYALNEGLRVDKAQMVMMDVSAPRVPAAAPGSSFKPLCRDAFPDQVRRLPGVLGAACSSSTALDIGDSNSVISLPDGSTTTVGIAVPDYGFFELYGVKPVAGRLFSRDHPEDETSLTPPPEPRIAVINEKAARALGYASPGQAIGRSFRSKGQPSPVRIIGVVPDFAFDLTHGAVRSMIYVLFTPNLDNLNIKLRGRDIPETLKAIDALWKATRAVRPPRRRFVDDYLQTIYVAAIRQGYLIDALCGVAVFIACLGLFGLAAFTAERRTREIGVRKAMGASRGDIVRLLLWQFTRPVLWANLIAWPVGWWAMDRWLQGFARHIALQPWLFVAASAAALAIAWITVFAHTLKVAGAKPVGALRYE